MTLRTRVLHLLPHSIYDAFLRILGLSGSLRPDRKARHDLRRIAITPASYFEVFWKDLPIGKGPALSVFIENLEILRFDCFGKGRGHFHAALFTPVGTKEHRVFFPEETRLGQIERTHFELHTNLVYYSERNCHARVRRATLDRTRLETAAAEARAAMCSLLETIPGIRFSE